MSTQNAYGARRKSFAIADLFSLSLFILYLYSTCFFIYFERMSGISIVNGGKKKITGFVHILRKLFFVNFHRIFKCTKNTAKSKYSTFKRLYWIYYLSPLCCECQFSAIHHIFSVIYYSSMNENLYAKFGKMSFCRAHNAKRYWALEKITN